MVVEGATGEADVVSDISIGMRDNESLTFTVLNLLDLVKEPLLVGVAVETLPELGLVICLSASYLLT